MNILNRQQFHDEIYRFYRANERDFPFRHISDPYKVLVSEIMLQQTQTTRVVEYFNKWIARFPSAKELANAPLREVLSMWQGLGYNRRAIYLHKCAKHVSQELNNQFPQEVDELIKLPGIGPYTAAAVSTFAFNKPNVFIETNIRTVFIHFFFQNLKEVHDKEIFPKIEEMLDKENPREWYYALMDYGSMLKKKLPNPSRKSKHHTKQSKFKGSDRQIRGIIIRILTKQHSLSQKQIIKQVITEKFGTEIQKTLPSETQDQQTQQQASSEREKEERRIIRILTQLVDEEMIAKEKQQYLIR